MWEQSFVVAGKGLERFWGLVANGSGAPGCDQYGKWETLCFQCCRRDRFEADSVEVHALATVYEKNMLPPIAKSLLVVLIWFSCEMCEASWFLDVGLEMLGFMHFQLLLLLRTRILLFWPSENYHLAGLVPWFYHPRPRSLLIASGLQILGIVASFCLCWGTLGQFWDIGKHNKQQNNTLRSRP